MWRSWSAKAFWRDKQESCRSWVRPRVGSVVAEVLGRRIWLRDFRVSRFVLRARRVRLRKDGGLASRNFSGLLKCSLKALGERAPCPGSRRKPHVTAMDTGADPRASAGDSEDGRHLGSQALSDLHGQTERAILATQIDGLSAKAKGYEDLGATGVSEARLKEE